MGQRIAFALCREMIVHAHGHSFTILNAGHFVGNKGSDATRKNNGFVATGEILDLFHIARNETLKTIRYCL